MTATLGIMTSLFSPSGLISTAVPVGGRVIDTGNVTLILAGGYRVCSVMKATW